MLGSYARELGRARGHLHAFSGRHRASARLGAEVRLIPPLPATLFCVPARFIVRVVKRRVVTPPVPREIPLPLREVPRLRPGGADVRLPRGALLRAAD